MNAQARAARAATARAERERKARAAKMRNLAISIAVVVVLAIAAVIVIPRLHSSSSAKVVTPAGVVDYKGVHGAPFGPATAPVTITLFEDFQCPICLHLEQTSGAEFTKLANAGKIRIIYSMVSILDRESNGNAYSTRSASAFYCAPQQNRKALHDAFYADQPAENGHGRTDAQIVATAKKAGISSSAFTSCVEQKTYAGYAAQQTTYASDHYAASTGFGTPTMLVNGQSYPGVLTLTPAILDQIVAQASS
jgi:protein-disulfide isomerase